MLKNFSPQQFYEIFREIILGKKSDEFIKDFLLELNHLNLPQNAFTGAVQALREDMKKINAPQNAIDVCGTGGDGLNTLNISTAVCFVVAACGVAVAKHGNKAISSKSGSADIFSEIGIKISDDILEIEKNLREKKLCFLFAPLFHAGLKNVAAIRKSIAAPTIFNFLGPLLNPANTRFQLIGVAKKDVMEKIAHTIAQLNLCDRAYIVHGFDGMDEITLTDNSHLLRFENGKIQAMEIVNPQDFGFNKVAVEALRGADPKHNAQKLIALFNGEKSAYRDVVTLNAAFALNLASGVTVGEARAKIDEVIDKGDLIKLCQNLQN